MRLNKFIITAITVTLVSVLYVYQQSKIVYLAYQEQERSDLLEEFIDRNNNLQYELNHQMSLVSIEKLWKDGDFEWPHQEQLVSLLTEQQISENREEKEPGNLFTHIFGLKSQAEATPIKPR